MNFKSTLKKGSVIAALSLSLSAFAGVPGNDVLAAENTAAQKLVDSLKALNIAQVDYLYAYLQSVNLSDAEYNGIIANAQSVSNILKGGDPANLPSAQKVEVGRLFLESVKLAHLQASIVDNKGNAIDISTYTAGSASGLVIQLKDLKGNQLAVINPTKADLNAAAIEAKMNALTAAVQAKKELEKDGTFVPMPNAPLPNTDSNTVDYMALGGLLILLGGIAVVPAARFVRKSEVEA